MSEHEQAQEASHTGQHPYNTPEAQRTEGIVQSQPNSEDLSTRKFEPIHFLVADDNKTMRLLITKLMGRLGHDCDLVVNGEEAVEAYKKGHQAYQCVLMDVSMPVMGGSEAMRLIRTFEEENSLTPGNIVALTAGMRFAEDKERMRKLGYTTALRRPFRPNDLNSLLDELGLLREI
ncbi:CheY-like superfamily [Diaporthe sp. PMI_573]|jgi:CheY-like chemotaxis protein|nr:CheY-like superfamily [Diaporthaceae sp. PMI_573]